MQRIVNMFPNMLHHDMNAKINIFKSLQSFPSIAILSIVRTNFFYFLRLISPTFNTLVLQSRRVIAIFLLKPHSSNIYCDFPQYYTTYRNCVHISHMITILSKHCELPNYFYTFHIFFK